MLNISAESSKDRFSPSTRQHSENRFSNENDIDNNLCPNFKFDTRVGIGGIGTAEVMLIQPKPQNMLQQEMAPILRTLRWLGLYPNDSGAGSSELSVKLKNGFLRIYSILILFVNLAMFGFNVYVIKLFGFHYGFLHVETMTAILTGLKPLQASLNLFIFQLGLKNHQHLLTALSCAERSFSEVFHAKPRWRCIRIEYLLLSFFVGFVPFSMRLAQYVMMGEKPFQFWLSDISLFLVALMSLCQCVPLFYFQCINSLIRLWFRQLHRQLTRDSQLVQHNITFYYSRYLQLTKACRLLGEFLNPFLFFSLAMSVVVLCLTIYFFINAEMALVIPPNATVAHRVSTYFLPVWAGMQILTAIIYILCISISGLRTNEESRQILSIVLSVMPDTDEGKFQVMCWVQKIQTQYSWCLTVWRAFPIERGLLFTLISMIATYAVVLLKLQQSLGCQMDMPLLNDSLFT